MKPGVSVVIPAYASQDYIHGCLEAVSLQRYLEDKYSEGIPKDFEVLLGIDNCPDTLTEVERIMGDYPWLKVFVFFERQYPFIIRNTLAGKAKYTTLIFFDADDIMLPNLVSATVKKIRDCHIVRYRRQNYWDRPAKPQICPRDNLMATFVRPRLARRDYTFGTFGIHYSTFHDKLGGFLPWKCAADLEFQKRAGKTGLNVKFLRDDIYLFRRKHYESITHAEETAYNSPLREHYKRLPVREGRIEPVLAKFRQIK